MPWQRERISGLHLPHSSSLSLHSPALDSEHMPKRIRAALICTQCEIQLGMPQVQPEALQQWQEMTKKKLYKIYFHFHLSCFLFFIFLWRHHVWPSLVSPSSRPVCLTCSGYTRLCPFQFQGHIAIFIEVGTKQTNADRIAQRPQVELM